MRLTIPCVGDEEIEAVAGAIKSGWLTQGKKVETFESAVAEYLDVKYAVATSSCTTALHLSLRVLGIGPCDYVIVSDFTYPATANVVVHCWAIPVLADIELATFALDPAKLEELIGPLIRAILLVHPFGLAANLGPIMEIANRRGIPVINDAACSLGTTYNGRHISDFGVMTCFSFHPRKVITTGEGGMVVTNDSKMACDLRAFREDGLVDGKFKKIGYNYRMSDINAAVGLTQMEKLDWMIERRRVLARWYRTELFEFNGVSLPSPPGWGGHIYQSFVILLHGMYDRDNVLKKMWDRGIETQIGTYAVHALPAFSKTHNLGDLPNSFFAYNQTLALPIFPDMLEDDVVTVCRALKESLA